MSDRVPILDHREVKGLSKSYDLFYDILEFPETYRNNKRKITAKVIKEVNALFHWGSLIENLNKYN